MKRFDTYLMFYTTKKLKRDMRKRAKELELTMSDYVRTLIKRDLKINDIVNNEINNQNNTFDMDNLNKKLSGYYRGL